MSELTRSQRARVFLGVVALAFSFALFSWSCTAPVWQEYGPWVELNPLNRVLMDVWLPLLLVTAAFLPLVFAYLVWRRNEYLGFLMLGIALGVAGLDALVWIWTWIWAVSTLCSPVKICFYLHIWWTMEKEKDPGTIELRKTQRTRFRLPAPRWASGGVKSKAFKL